MRLTLPAAFRHSVALAGAALASTMAIVFVVLLLIGSFGFLENPYFGLLLFVAVPAAFVVGPLLAAVKVGQIGHLEAPGCFRCHDDNHKAKDGRVIRQDCEMCHGIS